LSNVQATNRPIQGNQTLGRVERYLREQIESQGTIHLTLIDPEKADISQVAGMATRLEKVGTSGIMIGGSTSISVYKLDEIVKALKQKVTVPVILFPNDVTGISQFADAIFFMSLLNSSNPHYITGVQALGAPLVKKYQLEAIPMGYIIIGDSSASAAFVGYAHPIPMDKPELATIYALAAQYLGMRFVYLEAGSGARRHVPPSMVRVVKASLDIPIIVGGGIRSPEVARKIARSGAGVIVTGTLVESRSIKTIKRLITSLKGK
jgi:phosphoglycerol geranylgeranyltransferase